MGDRRSLAEDAALGEVEELPAAVRRVAPRTLAAALERVHVDRKAQLGRCRPDGVEQVVGRPLRRGDRELDADQRVAGQPPRELGHGIDVDRVRDRRAREPPHLARKVIGQGCREPLVVVIREGRPVAPVGRKGRAQARLPVGADGVLELGQVGIRPLVAALGREVAVDVGRDAARQHLHRLVERRQVRLDRRQRVHQHHPRLERLVGEAHLSGRHALGVLVGDHKAGEDEAPRPARALGVRVKARPARRHRRPRQPGRRERAPPRLRASRRRPPGARRRPRSEARAIRGQYVSRAPGAARGARTGPGPAPRGARRRRRRPRRGRWS